MCTISDIKKNCGKILWFKHEMLDIGMSRKAKVMLDIGMSRKAKVMKLG